MPYKKVEPVPPEEMEEPEPESTGFMLKKRYEGHNTICQKLREIYRLTDDPEIKLKLRVATAMAKSMHKKLKWYRENEINKEQ